jgi:hypothetical protein
MRFGCGRHLHCYPSALHLGYSAGILFNKAEKGKISVIENATAIRALCKHKKREKGVCRLSWKFIFYNGILEPIVIECGTRRQAHRQDVSPVNVVNSCSSGY